MIARVFPRRTKATPTDKYAFVGEPGLFIPDDIEEVHISVTFTWDLPTAERLERAWRPIAPVKIGGPATGMKGGNFTPGIYMGTGYVITSRGCPNGCWFCSVPKREGGIRELPITNGWNVCDDNLLACSEEHIRRVFAMLKKQNWPVQFTGGLEAARLADWHIDLLADLKPDQVFFAYDTPDDYKHLWNAGIRLWNKGFKKGTHDLRCYVLVGYPGDTIEQAETRLRMAWTAGFLPMAMLYRDLTGFPENRDWIKFQRTWARPALMIHKLKEKAI